MGRVNLKKKKGCS